MDDKNKQLKVVGESIEKKIEMLRGEIVNFKKEKLKELLVEVETEKLDYEEVVKTFKFFKLKHSKNIYTQDKIKKNEEQIKVIESEHSKFKQRINVKIEQLGHNGFIPIEAKEKQEEVFYFEIKEEEFKEIYNINKDRYENTLKMAIERFSNDSDTLVDEFSDLGYRKIK